MLLMVEPQRKNSADHNGKAVGGRLKLRAEHVIVSSSYHFSRCSSRVHNTTRKAAEFRGSYLPLESIRHPPTDVLLHKMYTMHLGAIDPNSPARENLRECLTAATLLCAC